jgi:hypothetical protein
MDFEEVNRYVTGMITAADVRYDLGDLTCSAAAWGTYG